MINPNTCGVLNRDAVVVNDTGDSQVLNNHVGGVGNRNTVRTDVPTALVTDYRLIRSNSETSWQVE